MKAVIGACRATKEFHANGQEIYLQEEENCTPFLNRVLKINKVLVLSGLELIL
jgi:hypothetical protein